jgi:hypothetical protein
MHKKGDALKASDAQNEQAQPAPQATRARADNPGILATRPPKATAPPLLGLSGVEMVR